MPSLRHRGLYVLADVVCNSADDAGDRDVGIVELTGDGELVAGRLDDLVGDGVVEPATSDVDAEVALRDAVCMVVECGRDCFAGGIDPGKVGDTADQAKCELVIVCRKHRVHDRIDICDIVVEVRVAAELSVVGNTV